MNSKIVAIVAIAAAGLIADASSAAPKSKTNKEEGIGLGAGAAVGAIAGGPVGFVIGAALGGWTGDKFHRERAAKREAEERLAQADALTQSLQGLLAGTESQNENLRLVMRDQEVAYRDALRQALDVEIYFHTGESTLDAAVQDRIRQLGEIMQDFDELTVVVEGHADPRGDEEYNQQLSAERATAVRDALIQSGLPAERITASAKGEQAAQAMEGDLDAMALERKVNLSIVHPSPRENRVAQQR
jgi:outer membrane protein OmpA-like peptidoglycan-associated protein